MIILDADFLSAFLKINALDDICRFFQVEELFIPTAVQKEIAQTKLIGLLNEAACIKVVSVKPKKLGGVEDCLGEGEKEVISMAGSSDLILMNDKKACEIAERHGLKTVNIPGFLLSMKKTGFKSKKEISSLMNKLAVKDFYIFSKSDEVKLRE